MDDRRGRRGTVCRFSAPVIGVVTVPLIERPTPLSIRSLATPSVYPPIDSGVDPVPAVAVALGTRTLPARPTAARTNRASGESRGHVRGGSDAAVKWGKRS